MNTVKELLRNIKTNKKDGRVTGTLQCEGYTIDVEILDVRKAWDWIDCLVTPLQGSGEVWVSAERVSVANKDREGKKGREK